MIKHYRKFYSILLISLLTITTYSLFISPSSAQTLQETRDVTVSVSIPQHLTFALNGVVSGGSCPNASATAQAEITSTATDIDYGTYNGATRKIACQETIVTTNANAGYRLTIQQDHPIQSTPTIQIPKFQGSSGSADTWTTPEVWSIPISPSHGYFGFTTSDTSNYPLFTLNRYGSFQADATTYEIVSAPGPVLSDTNYISYQLETDDLQSSGNYSNTVTYIVTAYF